VSQTITLKYYVDFSLGKCSAVILSDGIIIEKFDGQIGQSIPLTQVDNKLIEATAGAALKTALAATNPALLGATVLSSLFDISTTRPGISGSQSSGGEIDISLPMEAFLIIERPQCAIAQTYNSEKGRPSLINKQLSNCKGFTSMSDPKVNALCTAEENREINNLLKSGVIING
jgi:hypothetical protein